MYEVMGGGRGVIHTSSYLHEQDSIEKRDSPVVPVVHCDVPNECIPGIQSLCLQSHQPNADQPVSMKCPPAVDIRDHPFSS